MTGQTTIEPRPTPAVSRGAIRYVLVVDDSPSQRRILSKTLSRFGYEVRDAASGEAALKICADKPPDLVLSDWMMPGMDGLSFCRAFREMTRDHYGYFILLTSKSEKDEVARGFEAGADDFLTKPVNSTELLARISAGERILAMQQELRRKTDVISDTLEELQALYDSLDRDLEEAKKLQQSLVPDCDTRHGRGRVAQMLRSSGHVGGDLVGHFTVGPRWLGLYSIDVSGHGVSSALMTARLAGYLSATVPGQNVALERGPDGLFVPRVPASVVATLNRMIHEDLETEHYFTMLYALADLETGRVELCQAGHPHPLVQRGSGTIETIGAGGLPVGLVPGAHYDQYDVTLGPGDRLMVFSDGVSECPGVDGTVLGDDSLLSLISGLKDRRGGQLFDHLLWHLSTFAGTRQFPDDISGILLELLAENDA